MNWEQLYQWTVEVSEHLPSLNRYQQQNVALFSSGVVLSGSSQLKRISAGLWGMGKWESMRRRLQRWVGNEGIGMHAFFSDWTRWVMAGFKDYEQVYLLVDETKIGERLAAMVVGVAYEKRCLPLAWRCYRANDATAYPAEGQVAVIRQLLEAIQVGMPSGLKVCVLADRGIGCSPALMRAVEHLGWQYLFRVTKQSKLVADDGQEYTIYDQVQPGEEWAMSGKMFKQRGQVPAHARVLWATGKPEPWALVTNDPTLSGYEYAYRNWQEQAFRDLKSAGWQWQASTLLDPARAERLLILLVIAYTWVISLAVQAIRTQRPVPSKRTKQGTRARVWSLFREGLSFFRQCLGSRQPLVFPFVFIPDTRFG